MAATADDDEVGSPSSGGLCDPLGRVSFEDVRVEVDSRASSFYFGRIQGGVGAREMLSEVLLVHAVPEQDAFMWPDGYERHLSADLGREGDPFFNRGPGAVGSVGSDQDPLHQ
jgi:hypothetical protein